MFDKSFLTVTEHFSPESVFLEYGRGLRIGFPVRGIPFKVMTRFHGLPLQIARNASITVKHPRLPLEILIPVSTNGIKHSYTDGTLLKDSKHCLTSKYHAEHYSNIRKALK